MEKVVVRKLGNARIRRALIDEVPLKWDPANPELSVPKQLPAGKHLFTWYVKGRKDENYGFLFEEPAGIPCVVPDQSLPKNGARNWGRCSFKLK